MAYNLDLALRAFASWGGSDYPIESTDNLRRFVGPKEADAAVARVSEIIDQLDRIIPDWTRHDLDEAAAHAVREIADLHPDLGRDGIAVLKWVYTSWYQ